MAKTYKFFLEASDTRIYHRIVLSFQEALLELGHKVVLLEIGKITYEDLLSLFQVENPDFLFLTNSCCWFSNEYKKFNKYPFEIFDIPVIFIHHDNLFTDLREFEDIQKKLTAFYEIRERSYHFCLEYENYLDLRSLGLNNVFTINHASEFKKFLPEKDYEYGLSFVGHLLPSISLNSTTEKVPLSHRLQANIWNRIVNLETKLGNYATEFAREKSNEVITSIDFLAFKYFYISILYINSFGFRGEIIKRIQKAKIDIIGGDLHSQNRKIEKENIQYHASQNDYNLSKNIYKTSRINLNITSLQFDDAVINRVIDIGAVGGFVLTDSRSDLTQLTRVHQEISYRTIEELNHKIEYYLHRDNDKERMEIAEVFHEDIKQKCSYLSVVEFILSQINSAKRTETEMICVDLGCGSRKTEGFIGVDVLAQPNVDIVANLNRRFPFSDDSIDVVRAYDVIEHLENRIHTMNEIWRIAKPDGMIELFVPSTDGRGAFQDPTHVSFWNINSFKYYCIQYPTYLELCRGYGFQGAFSIVDLKEVKFHDNVIHVHAVLKAVKHLQTDYQPYLDSLNKINLALLPNWQQPEEEVFNSLSNCLNLIIRHPERKAMTILIATDNYEDEEFNLLMFNLLMESDIEIEEDPELRFIAIKYSDWQLWNRLSSYISGKIFVNSPVSDVIKFIILPNVEAVECNDLLNKRWLSEI